MYADYLSTIFIVMPIIIAIIIAVIIGVYLYSLLESPAMKLLYLLGCVLFFLFVGFPAILWYFDVSTQWA